MNWGSWGANYSPQEVSKLINCAYESGINTFDHADIYGGYKTEELFGKGFKISGLDRDKVVYPDVLFVPMVAFDKHFNRL